MTNNEPAVDYENRPRCHVYGRTAALCIEGHPAPNGNYQTVTMECAPREEGGKSVLWQQGKISIMLGEDELPVVTAFFAGYWPRNLALKRDGKGIELMRQSGGIRIRASKGFGQLCNIAVKPSKVYSILGVLLGQLHAASPQQEPTFVIAQLRALSQFAPPQSD